MIERAPRPAAGAAGPEAHEELDVRGDVCPYPFLKSKLALERLAPGQVLRVIVGNAASARDVPRGLSEAGHAVLGVDAVGPAVWAIVVRKGSRGSPHLRGSGHEEVSGAR